MQWRSMGLQLGLGIAQPWNTPRVPVVGIMVALVEAMTATQVLVVEQRPREMTMPV
jgi:hypothetical protein